MAAPDHLNFALLNWDGESAWRESLGRVHTDAIEEARRQIDWYHDHRGQKKRAATWFRLGALTFATIGTLIPVLTPVLLAASTVKDTGAWLASGFVALGIAGAFVAWDKFWGYSTGWVRYMVTQQAIEKALKELHYDWAINMAKCKNRLTHDVLLTQLALLKQFTQRILTQVQEETRQWVQEFQSGLVDLEQKLATQKPSRGK